MTAILTGAPIWVWPLLVGLILIGLRARKDRMAPAVLIYLLPLLGLLTLRSVMQLPAAPWIWLIFGIAYLIGVLGGHHLQGHWVLGRTGRMVQVKGENLTLLVVMVVFWANFVGGFLQAVAPQLYASAAFHLAFTTLVALSAGSFAGRALRIWRSV